MKGIDYDDTFNLIIQLINIRTVLSIMVSLYYPIWQLDVKNAFINGFLNEVVHM